MKQPIEQCNLWTNIEFLSINYLYIWGTKVSCRSSAVYFSTSRYSHKFKWILLGFYFIDQHKTLQFQCLKWDGEKYSLVQSKHVFLFFGISCLIGCVVGSSALLRQIYTTVRLYTTSKPRDNTDSLNVETRVYVRWWPTEKVPRSLIIFFAILL